MLYVVHTGAAQLGTVRRTQDSAILAHPIMEAMADTFRAVDEWYEFSYGPTWSGQYGVKVLYYLDESTLATAPAHPMNPHPMAWFRENHLGNRFFYTPMVHNASGVNSTAGNDFFTSMTLRGLEYLAGYQTTSIRMNGRGLYHNNERVKGVRMLRRGEALRIETEGRHRLEILDMRGRRLHVVTGRGQASHRPGALSRPGMYVVKVSSGRTAYTQRVMVQ
jgi:hypothetical protein